MTCSDDKNKTVLAISLVLPILFKAVSSTILSISSFLCFGLPYQFRVSPGAILFTLMLNLPNSLDKVFVNETKESFDDE